MTIDATPAGTDKIPGLVGLLLIVAMATGLMSYALTGSILAAPDCLTQLSAHAIRVGVGTALLLVRAAALAIIPVALFATLRRQNMALALGYLLLKSVFETITYVVMAMSWLSLLSLSREYVGTAAANLFAIRAMGALLLRVYSWTVTNNVVVFSFAALILYTVLLRARLAPRWILTWGLVVIPLHLVMDLLCMFGLARESSTSHVLMNLAMFLQEFVFALWIIIKGTRARLAKAVG